MATALATVTVAAGQTVNTDLSQYAAGRILLGCRITNESNLAVQVGGIIPGAEWLPGWVENLWTGTPDAPLSRQLSLMGQALSSATSAPSSVCLITLYWLGDHDLPSGRWPIALARFVDVGNVLVSNSAANELEQDLLTPFVLTGLVCTKDVSVANQLDMTAGVALIRQSDSGVARVAPAAQNFLTSAPTSTYFLDLNPDGTFSFATSHSAVSNHLTIASCTTDGSGNILAVTDARVLTSTLLAAMLGGLSFPNDITAGGNVDFGALVSGSRSLLSYFAAGHEAQMLTPQAGAPAELIGLYCWSGSALVKALGLSASGVNGVGGQATAAGSVGVPVIVAQAPQVAVTVTTVQQILSFTPSVTGQYRVSGHFIYRNPVQQKPAFQTQWTDPDLNVGTLAAFFALSSNSVGEFMTNAQATVMGNNQAVACAPITFNAKAGVAIGVQFQDGGGTPNDVVSVVIERLS